MKSPRLNILFSGMIAGDPNQGGATWAVLQYVLGLRRLGHHVLFVEPVARASLRPIGGNLADSKNAAYFRQVVADFGLQQCSALLATEDHQTVGLGFDELRERVRGIDILVNVSGMLTDPALVADIPRRVYLDLDPGFNQLWQTVQMIDMRFSGHTHFVTVGQSIGHEDCPVPSCGHPWIPTAQPVLLEEWPVAGPITTNALTTIGNWRGYGSIESGGVHYGQKAHSLRPLIDLPRRTSERFVLALAIHPAETKDLASLAQNGWHVLDPADVAASTESYRHFIQGSKAEFGVAKSGYVASRCGWFSDRSACYLACGRPVIAQETGFSRWIPTGEGLFSFCDGDGVLKAIETMNRDYERHSGAARHLAEQYFDSDKVLTQLLRAIGVDT